MSDNAAEVFAAVQRMKAERVVKEYALGGAMALVFWSEPVATFDLDIFVLLESEGVLVSLAPIYEWASGNGYPTKAEHVIGTGNHRAGDRRRPAGSAGAVRGDR